MARLFRITLLTACLLSASPRRYEAEGLVLAVDISHMTVTISHSAIGDYMDAMAMPFHVRDAGILRGLHSGDKVAFTLAIESSSSWIDAIHAVPFESAERDPALASRLKLLDSVMGKQPAPTIALGSQVPDFTLTDQAGNAVTFSKLRGKVVAIDFVYTRCPLPDYCFRLSNNFRRIQERFRGNRDLALLTISFDPLHDTPGVLARYAETWKSDPSMWRFLTGRPADVARICAWFGVASWRDDGLFVHTLHTLVVDRQGRLAANIEGNRFTARQLGDLIDVSLKAGKRLAPARQ